MITQKNTKFNGQTALAICDICQNSAKFKTTNGEGALYGWKKSCILNQNSFKTANKQENRQETAYVKNWYTFCKLWIHEFADKKSSNFDRFLYYKYIKCIN